MTLAIDIVQQYHQAWTSGDLEKALDFIAEEIHCSAPGEEIRDKSAYREFLADFSANLTGVIDIAQFADGNQAALFYYPQTATTDDTAAGEYFVVEDEKIVKSIVVFDRAAFDS